MIAYANPTDRTDQTQRADGYGLVRFRKSDRSIIFECWPRFIDVTAEDAEQFRVGPSRFHQEITMDERLLGISRS